MLALRLARIATRPARRCLATVTTNNAEVSSSSSSGGESSAPSVTSSRVASVPLSNAEAPYANPLNGYGKLAIHEVPPRETLSVGEKNAATATANNAEVASSSSTSELFPTPSFRRIHRHRCFNCGDFGHHAAACPKAAIIKCYNCGEEGHFSRNCVEPEKPKMCYKCGQEGHITRDCTNPIICHSCGGQGHMSRDCPKSLKCFNCSGFGHISRNCTQLRKRACFTCGSEDHISRDCPGAKLG